MKIFNVTLISVFLATFAFCESPQQWKSRNLADIELAKKSNHTDAWNRLNSIFISLGKKVPQSAHPDEIEIFEKAQQAIMSQPGYAWKVYENIQRQESEVLAAIEQERTAPLKSSTTNTGALVNEYLRESAWSIKALGCLPNEETVEVLVKLLDDDRTGKHGAVKNSFQGYFEIYTDIPSNSRLAVSALKQLEVGPIPGAEFFLSKTLGSPEEAEIYKDWWAEVQAGKRDYHFGWKAWDRSKILPKDQWPPDPYAPVTATQKVLPTNTSPQVSAPKEKNLNWALYSSGLLVLVASLVAWNRKPQS